MHENAVTDKAELPSVVLPPVSLVVPTYRESGNLPELVERLERVRAAFGDMELLIIDDDSADGTERVVRDLDRAWVRLIVRKGKRGLSSAVLEGLRLARYDIAVVMDADLSHPPEAVPSLVRSLVDGADFAIGSRYVPGGSTDAHWGVLRRLNSCLATLLARPLTAAKDPMSGFFAIRRDMVNRAEGLDPIGYKIGLELLVRCRCQTVRETPIHFADRKVGQSKLSLGEQWRYLRHVHRLMAYRHPLANRLSQILILGIASSLAVLLILAGMGLLANP